VACNNIRKSMCQVLNNVLNYVKIKFYVPAMSAKDNNNIIITVQMVLIKDKYL